MVASSGLLERILAPVKSVLATAKMDKSQVAAFEIVGGSVRIPMVAHKLTEFYGKELSRTCDGDESVARGCTFMCAKLSEKFRVKAFEVKDLCHSHVKIGFGPVPQDGKEPVIEGWKDAFLPTDNLPLNHLMNLNTKTKPLHILAQYDEKDRNQGILYKYVIDNFPQDTANATDAKVKLHTSMSQDGILSIFKAEYVETVPVTTTTPTTPTTPTSPTDSQPMDTSSEKKDAPKHEKKRTPLNLNLVYSSFGLTPQQLKEFAGKEGTMANQVCSTRFFFSQTVRDLLSLIIYYRITLLPKLLKPKTSSKPIFTTCAPNWMVL
jgi:heat shock protein 4